MPARRRANFPKGVKRAALDRSDTRALMTAASHALRSYHHGNAAPELASEIADACDAALAKGNALHFGAEVELLEVARVLVEPFANLDDEYLREISEADPRDLHIIGGKGLTAHLAATVLRARAAIANTEGR